MVHIADMVYNDETQEYTVVPRKHTLARFWTGLNCLVIMYIYKSHTNRKMID